MFLRLLFYFEVSPVIQFCQSFKKLSGHIFQEYRSLFFIRLIFGLLHRLSQSWLADKRWCRHENRSKISVLFWLSLGVVALGPFKEGGSQVRCNGKRVSSPGAPGRSEDSFVRFHWLDSVSNSPPIKMHSVVTAMWALGALLTGHESGLSRVTVHLPRPSCLALSNSAGLTMIDRDSSGQYWLTLTPGQHFKSQHMKNGEKLNCAYKLEANISLLTVLII